MASFEGVQLTDGDVTGGSILMLNTTPATSGVARFPECVEVEIRKNVPGVIVRGLPASGYESVVTIAPEWANRGLDIFAINGLAKLALADFWTTHVAWWSTGESATARIFYSATLPLTLSGKGEVRNPDGTIKRAPESQPTWQESMRYFRMSELTDDLFDAFRNTYLALESLLSTLEPMERKTNGSWEHEDEWFKRALAKVAGGLNLASYIRSTTGNPLHDIYDELHNKVRVRVFHAKTAHHPYLPQDLAKRADVADAKNRYTRLYLDLAQQALNGRFPSGGTRVNSSIAREIAETLSEGWSIAFTDDPGPVDTSSHALSPTDPSITLLPTSPYTDPRGEGFTTIIAKTPISNASNSPVVGRITTVDSNGKPGITQTLGGCMVLGGFDLCEFVISFAVVGREIRKTVYAT